MATAGDAIKLTFDKERKLKARHKYIRNAVIQSGKSVHQLLVDPFGGFAYVLQALIQPGSTEVISVDRASELIDLYLDKGGTVEQLQAAMVQCVQSYMRIENTPTPDESDPNATSPVVSGDANDTD